jgi:ankyrin repeat protein
MPSRDERDLVSAIQHNDADEVSRLLDLRKNIFSTEFKLSPNMVYEGQPILFYAAGVDNFDALKALIEEGANVNAIYNGVTLLYLVSQNRHLEAVKLLIAKENIEVDKTTPDKATPLFMVVFKGYAEIADLLINAGANVNITYEGKTPLHLAIQKGYAAMVDLLIKARADVNIMYKGKTPLHLAIQKGNVAMVDLLIKAGADVSETYNGVTLLYIACQKEGCVKIVELLTAAEADPNQVEEGKIPPLYIVCQNGGVEKANLLIKAGARVDEAYDGVTPLFIAVQNGDTEMVALLIKEGADIDKARVKDGVTPLYAASQNGDERMVALLIKEGADIDKARTDDETTPFFIAKQKGYKAVEKLLQDEINKRSEAERQAAAATELALGRRKVTFCEAPPTPKVGVSPVAGVIPQEGGAESDEILFRGRSCPATPTVLTADSHPKMSYQTLAHVLSDKLEGSADEQTQSSMAIEGAKEDGSGAKIIAAYIFGIIASLLGGKLITSDGSPRQTLGYFICLGGIMLLISGTCLCHTRHKNKTTTDDISSTGTHDEGSKEEDAKKDEDDSNGLATRAPARRQHRETKKEKGTEEERRGLLADPNQSFSALRRDVP